MPQDFIEAAPFISGYINVLWKCRECKGWTPYDDTCMHCQAPRPIAFDKDFIDNPDRSKAPTVARYFMVDK